MPFYYFSINQPPFFEIPPLPLPFHISVIHTWCSGFDAFFFLLLHKHGRFFLP